MKFSKKLHYKAHPKYREHYIAYKELKKVIKLITGKDTSTYTIKEVTSKFGNISALSGTEYRSTESRFQDLLNLELEKINNFTISIIKDWYKEASFCYIKLKDEQEERKRKWGKEREREKGKENEELEKEKGGREKETDTGSRSGSGTDERSALELDLIERKLNELGNTLIFLESYKNINFIGFRKITKKFDKHNDKNVSSSFYISVVIKSFFMNYDINFLVCILSICFKYLRYSKRGVRSVRGATVSFDELKLANNDEQENSNEMHIENNICKNAFHNNINEMNGCDREGIDKWSLKVETPDTPKNYEVASNTFGKEIKQNIQNEKALKQDPGILGHSEGGFVINANKEALLAEAMDDYGKGTEKEKKRKFVSNHVEQKESHLNNKKYIIKTQDLIYIKIEIAKRFLIKYYDLEEYEFFPSIKKLKELIFTAKIQNYLITIYFDDVSLSTYHNFVNRNVENEHNQIRIRSYIYVKGKKQEEKTFLQRFNIYESSSGKNEQHFFLKDLPSNDLHIKNVNDLFIIRDTIIEKKQKKKNEKEEDGEKQESGLYISKGTTSEMLVHHANEARQEKNKSRTGDGGEKDRKDVGLLDENQRLLKSQDDFLNIVNEIEKRKLESCVRSKCNRLYFGEEDTWGYIDENISYWSHNNEKNIKKRSEIQDTMDENEDEDDEEEEDYGDEEEEGEETLVQGKHRGYSNKKYVYFDYAVIDICTKKGSNKIYFLNASNLTVAREIWGYSSFLQGISLLYADSISVFPHWRIYTYSDFVNVESTSNSKEKGKRMGKTSKEQISNDNRKGNKQREDEEDCDDEEEEEEEDDDYDDIIINGNNEKRIKKGKEEYKKSITYTGASARIAHEHEVIFRKEIEKNKSSVDRDFTQFDHNINVVRGKNKERNNNANAHDLYDGNNVSANVFHRGNASDNKRGEVEVAAGGNRGEYSIGSHLLHNKSAPFMNENRNTLYEPLLDDQVMVDDGYKSSKTSSGKIFTFFKNFFTRKNSVHIKRPKNSVVRVEPKTFFANERTLLQWLNTSVLLSTISITLLNFSNDYGFISGIIMAPVAIFFIFYSFYIYLKRARALLNKEPINYTDRFGPCLLVVTLTFSLSTVVALNIISRYSTKV